MKPCGHGDLQPPFSHPIQSPQGGFAFPSIAGGGGAATRAVSANHVPRRGASTTAPMRAGLLRPLDDGAVALTSKPAGVPVDAEGCGAVQSWELFWLCRRGISPSGVWPVRRCCGGGSDAIVRGHGLPISGAFRFARPSSVRIEAVYHTEGLFDEAAATESPCVAP